MPSTSSYKPFPALRGSLRLTSLSTGDTIPHVIAYIFPALARHAVLRLLVDRRTVILLCTIAISFPLSLHRDIVKLSKSSSFGEPRNKGRSADRSSFGLDDGHRDFRGLSRCGCRAIIERIIAACLLNHSSGCLRGNRRHQFRSTLSYHSRQVLGG